MLKKFILLLLLPLLMACPSPNKDAEITTYYFIRHAEKDLSNPDNPNPDLTAEGLQRAEKWREILGQVRFDEVYSTDLIRTRKTAQPIAEAQGLSVRLYNHKDLDYKQFLENTRGKTVLVVGHSNSTPKFVNWFVGYDKYEEIDEKQYGFLFQVVLLGDKVAASLFEID
ncbi:MAG: phosphoglycerate mutase family protein [Flavobacteriaceae bacterium]|nr:phosphoglycerate mutase family protein [Flavobacteriaceae bacterium]